MFQTTKQYFNALLAPCQPLPAPTLAVKSSFTAAVRLGNGISISNGEARNHRHGLGHVQPTHATGLSQEKHYDEDGDEHEDENCEEE